MPRQGLTSDLRCIEVAHFYNITKATIKFDFLYGIILRKLPSSAVYLSGRFGFQFYLASLEVPGPIVIVVSIVTVETRIITVG